MTCLLLIAGLLPGWASAASATATLTGPGTVRAGDTITVVFSLNSADGLMGASGTVRYDASKLTLSKTTKRIGGDWTVTFNQSAGAVQFVANDATQSSPINKNTALFEMQFRVGNVSAGEKLSITASGVEVSSGTLIGVGDTAYTVTIAEPLSTNNSLASLTVSNATISPAFNASTTSYTADVPFSVSKLDVKATAADSKAKVNISSPTLTPDGTTNVTITVTAENGAKKTYAIKVHREQDPNYVASGDNDLSGITVDGFLLSPVFSADVTEYVVWLPYETESVKISGKAADGKASVQVVGGDQLAAGQDNPVQVICTAENGEKKTYTVVVSVRRRMTATWTKSPPHRQPSQPKRPQQREKSPAAPSRRVTAASRGGRC